MKAKDPYQDRFLPHIIGSEKWKNSSKIGLEFSSSDSEQMEEENDEYWSDNDERAQETSSMNDTEFENFDVKQQQTRDMNNGEIAHISVQDAALSHHVNQNSNDYSESATPKVIVIMFFLRGVFLTNIFLFILYTILDLFKFFEFFHFRILDLSISPKSWQNGCKMFQGRNCHLRKKPLERPISFKVINLN